MEKLFLSVGLIRKPVDESMRWLTLWNESQNHWEFVVASRLEKESFRESITREVAWRLELTRDRDFLVSNMAQLNIEVVEVLPAVSSGEPVHLALAFYNVDIYRKQSMKIVDSLQNVRWLTSREVCNGASESGELIDPQVVEWINRWEIVLPWQSGD